MKFKFKAVAVVAALVFGVGTVSAQSVNDVIAKYSAFLQEALLVESNKEARLITDIRMRPAAAFRLQYISPCLAVSAEDLKSEKKEELYKVKFLYIGNKLF